MKSKTNYDIFDVTKLVLSFMIVAIHVGLYPMFLYPWLRLAVPLFFIISSFLLFMKLEKSPEESKDSIVKKYIIRLLKLYCFWFILLLPITIYLRRSWFSDGILLGIFNVIKNIFFGSTFGGSWYISSAILGILIVYFLSKKVNNKVSFLIFLLMYIFCCFSSSYDILKGNYFNLYVTLFGKPEFNFFVSCIYIYIGKMFSEEKFKKIKNWQFLILIIIFSFLLFGEWRMVYALNGYFSKDCYLFIAPLTFSIFGLLKNLKLNVKNSKLLRQFSSFLYPLNVSLVGIIKNIYKIAFNINIPIITFISTLLVASFLFYLVRKLENKSIFKILKYSY